VLSKFDRAIGGTIPRHRWAQLTATVAELPAAGQRQQLNRPPSKQTQSKT